MMDCQKLIPSNLVALRKESVDRNSALTFRADLRLVALRKESVDRNFVPVNTEAGHTGVALRKESVDRNDEGGRAVGIDIVALRKESVDRNFYGLLWILRAICRSPQGERG